MVLNTKSWSLLTRGIRSASEAEDIIRSSKRRFGGEVCFESKFDSRVIAEDKLRKLVYGSNPEY